MGTRGLDGIRLKFADSRGVLAGSCRGIVGGKSGGRRARRGRIAAGAGRTCWKGEIRKEGTWVY